MIGLQRPFQVTLELDEIIDWIPRFVNELNV